MSAKADPLSSAGRRAPVLLALGVVQGLAILLLAAATVRGMDLGAWMNADDGPASTNTSGTTRGSRGFRWFHK